MSNRKFLVPIASLVTALAVSPADANTNNEHDSVSLSMPFETTVQSAAQNPFDFVLKRSNSAPQVLGWHSSHSSHSSHASHSSHSSHSSHFSGY